GGQGRRGAHVAAVRGQDSKGGGRGSRRARGQKGSAGASPSRIRTLPGAAGVRERSMTEREFAIDVVRRLRDAGFEALWAGGCVRDELLGLTPADYDVATNARPEAGR